MRRTSYLVIVMVLLVGQMFLVQPVQLDPAGVESPLRSRPNVPQGTQSDPEITEAAGPHGSNNSQAGRAAVSTDTSNFLEQDPDWYTWQEAETVKVTESFPDAYEYSEGATSTVLPIDGYQINHALTDQTYGSNDDKYLNSTSWFDGTGGSESYQIESVAEYQYDASELDGDLDDDGIDTGYTCAVASLEYDDGTYCDMYGELTSTFPGNPMEVGDREGVTVTYDVLGQTGYVVLKIRLRLGENGGTTDSAWVYLIEQVDSSDLDMNGKLEITIYVENTEYTSTTDYNSTLGYIVTASGDTGYVLVDTADLGLASAGGDAVYVHVDYVGYFGDGKMKAGVADTSGSIDIQSSSEIVQNVQAFYGHGRDFQFRVTPISYDLNFVVNSSVLISDDASTNTTKTISETSITGDVPNSYFIGDSDGYYIGVRLVHEYRYYFHATSSEQVWSRYWIQYLNYDTQSYENASVTLIQSANFTSSVIQYLRGGNYSINEMSFTRNEVTFNSRLERKVSVTDPSNGIARNIITVDTLGANVTISLPNDLEYSSINPVVDVQENTTEFSFIANFLGDYEIRYVYGPGKGRDYVRRPQHLAIVEKTGSYLRCPGFECGTLSKDHWERRSDLLPATLNLSTQVVHRGSYAAYFDFDGSPQESRIPMSSLSYTFHMGEYYLSYAIYPVRAGTIRIYTGMDASATNQYEEYVLGTDLELNRWHQILVYSHYYDYSVTNTEVLFALRSTSGTPALYFDDIRFFQSSGKAETTDTGETTVSGQFIDGYTFLPLPNLEVNWELRDRPDDTPIISKTLRTDENGIASYPYHGVLTPGEKESRWVSYDSYFSGESISYDGWPTDLSYWSASSYHGLDDYSEESDTTTATLGIYDTTGSGAIRFDPGSLVLSLADYMVFEVKTNVTYDIYTVTLNSANPDEFAFVFSQATTTSFTTYVGDFDDLSSSGSPDLSSIEWLEWVWSADSTKVAITFESIRFIQAQKSYFTAVPSGVDSYSYESNGLQNDQKNYLDFSESVCETEDASVYHTPAVCADGVFQVTDLHSSSVKYGYIRFGNGDGLAVDADYYTHLAIHYKVNTTLSLGSGHELVVYDGQWGNVVGSKEYGSIQADTWYLETFDLSSDADWTGTELSNGFQLVFQDDGNGAYSYFANTADVNVMIDYIYFTNGWDQGYAWEFEEIEDDSTLGVSGWQFTSSATAETKNGLISINAPTSYDGILAQLETDLSTADYYVEMSIRTTGVVPLSNWRIAFYDDGAFAQSQPTGDIPISFSHVTVIEPSVVDFDRIYIWTDASGDTGSVEIEYIRLIPISSSQPNLFVDTTTGLYYFDTGDNQTDYFATWSNGSYLGIVREYEFNYLQYQSSTTYSFTYARIWSGDGIYDLEPQLLGRIYSYDYTITSNEISHVAIVNQEGDFIDPRQYRIEVDSYRIYSDTFVWEDIDSTKNITISDFWGNILYQNTAETYSRFLEFELTLYSVKIYNEMDTPIFVSLTNGPVFESWILPGEIEEYFLFAATYNFTLQYSTSASSFSAATLNGTSLEYIYAVSAATALTINAFSILDVYANLVDLSGALVSVNGTLYAELGNLQIEIDLSNSTQVDLLLSNYAAILAAQSDAAEYMSELRITDRQVVDSAPSYSFSWGTNWGNSTVYGYINGTYQASTPEGSLIMTLATYGSYNLTWVINATGSTATYEYVYEAIVTWSQSQGLYQVHIDLVDSIGLGISYDTVAIYVNVSNSLTRLGQDFYWPNDTIQLVAKDFFGITLTTGSYSGLSVSDPNYIQLVVPLYELIFENTYEVGVEVRIDRNGNEMRFAVPSNASFSVTLSTGIYEFRFVPIYDDPTYDDNIAGNEPIQPWRASQDTFDHSKLTNYKIILEENVSYRQEDDPGSAIDRFYDAIIPDSVQRFFSSIQNSKAVGVFLFIISGLSAYWVVRTRVIPFFRKRAEMAGKQVRQL